MSDVERAVAAYYGSRDLVERVKAALVADGLGTGVLDPDDLAPFDQFHTGGAAATIALADRAELRPGQRVLDVGAGLGGPARLLATRYGCHVTALDLTPEFCAVSTFLTERCRLGDRVTVVSGDALALPFPDGAFDLVWTQHASMNVADKERFFSELRRVLESGGKLALADIATGEGGPPHYPAPWAADPELSFLVTPEEERELLLGSGFAELLWEDATGEAAAFFERARAESAAGSARALGRQLFLADAETKFANQMRNVAEDRIRIVRAVARAV